MSSLDLALLGLLLLAGLHDHFVRWPRTVRALAAGSGSARLRHYAVVLVEQWFLVGLVLALWIARGRAWSELWLAAPSGWRLVAGLVPSCLLLPFFVVQWRAIAALADEKRRALRPKLAKVERVLPHTRAEHRLFLALSVTAGVCEELLFRGYLVWLFTPLLGLYGAALLSVVLFGFGHAYQGRAPAIRSGLVGLFMALLALATGSLLPGMLLHAIVDVGGGTAGFLLLREDEPTGTALPAR